MNDRSLTISTCEISQPQWQTPTDLTQVCPDVVHIWRASACQAPQVLDQLLQTLSPDEQDRVGLLRFDYHRCRAIASRGILRSILGRYLKCDPKVIKFQYGTHGKPRVHASSLSNLEFNLSHSEDLIICAIALQPIGIDVEFFREMTHRDQLIKRYFSVKEQAMLNSLSAEVQHQAFFYYWTAKEAMLKAAGLGISDLKNVELNLANNHVQLFSTAGCDQFAASWHLHSFEPQSDYLASIALELPTMQLKYWQW